MKKEPEKTRYAWMLEISKAEEALREMMAAFLLENGWNNMRGRWSKKFECVWRDTLSVRVAYSIETKQKLD